MTRRVAPALLLLGLGYTAFLILRPGTVETVAGALNALGWSGFLLFGALRVGVITLMGFAWWIIVPGPAKPTLHSFVWARWLRDSVAEILPFSQLGGFVSGARAAAISGLPGPMAAASTIVDVTLELAAQLLFTALGLFVLIDTHPGSALTVPLFGWICAMAVATVAFIFIQRRGIALSERIRAGIFRDWVRAGQTIEALQTSMIELYARPWTLGRGVAYHALCWIAMVAEAWLALHLMGSKSNVVAVLGIESLLYAARSAAFFVPNALGVQEGAYLMLGGIFGVAPDLLLTLSLLKRARDLALGIPALFSWEAAEVSTSAMPALVTRDIPSDAT